MNIYGLKLQAKRLRTKIKKAEKDDTTPDRIIDGMESTLLGLNKKIKLMRGSKK